MGIVPLFFASALILQVPAEVVVKPRVVSVSMFKNGYAFVTREIPITDNSAKVVEVPVTSLGSLWFWSNEGQIDSVTGMQEKTPASLTVPLESSDEILRANIGKKFLFNMLYKDEKDGKVSDRRQTVEGILRTFSNGMITVESPEGTFILKHDKVDSVIAKDSSVVLSRDQKYEVSSHYYKIVTKNNAKSVMMMSLERGMTWAPGYAIDLSSPDKLVFTAKSTVLNDLLDFDNAKLRLITGFPNIQFQNILDPLTSGMSVDDWIRSISSGVPGGFGNGGGGMNSQSRAGEFTRKSAAGGAMLSGGQGLVPDTIDHIGYDPTDNSLIVRGSNEEMVNAPSEQLEDLFFYDLEKVSLKKRSSSCSLGALTISSFEPRTIRLLSVGDRKSVV